MINPRASQPDGASVDPGSSRVLHRLIDALGSAVSTESADLNRCQGDGSGHRSESMPLAVVTARSVEDVQTVMRIASKSSTPVVTRGAGTGLSGGAIGSGGEIVLSMLDMNAILEISVEEQLAVIQPGIINAELNRQLTEHGLWFTPDPASHEISTVGGNIATNAGGLLCAKYGVTRESVLGLDVVLADGKLITTGRRTAKGVAGLDLTSLMVGSEGTLGIIVEATVRVRRRVDGPVVTVDAAFDSVDSAARAAAAISASGLTPSAMELIAGSAMEAIAHYLQRDDVTGASLIVRFDGPGAEDEAHRATTAIDAVGGRWRSSGDPEEGEKLFAFRRAFHPAMAARGSVLIEDICVPRPALPAMFAHIASVENEYGLTIPTVAHAGDGNLHPNFVYEGPEIPDVIWAAAYELFRAALELGGTLTGEHGIGTLKRRWLEEELGEDQLELQRQVKAVFDPLGILNPGKVF